MLTTLNSLENFVYICTLVVTVEGLSVRGQSMSGLFRNIEFYSFLSKINGVVLTTLILFKTLFVS